MLRVISHPFGTVPPLAARSGGWNSALDSALADTPQTAALLQRLHAPGALAVTTGQQPGLFTGPAYTLHKAFGAIALARELERQWKRPVVPIFWVAGDDHDYAEASSAAWSDSDGNIVEWSLRERPSTEPQRSMSAEPLPLAVEDGLRALEHALPLNPARDATLEWLRRHYVPGRSLHHACLGALAEFLAPYGMLCFDPTQTSVKVAQRDLLRTALHRAPEIDATLAALPDAGTGIAAGEGATLVFLITDAGRDRLVVDGDGFRARRSGLQFSESEIDVLLEREPERFSANVLLRPIIESALIPTVAYVAGPGEFRYLTGQSHALYPLLDVPRQEPVPRWSGTVVPGSTSRLLRRLALSAESVMNDDGTIARELLDRRFPGDARQGIDALQQQLKRSGSVILAAGKRLDPVLDRAIAGRMSRIEQITSDVESVFLRHLKKRHAIEYSQFERARRMLRPLGKAQERVFIAPAFLGRYDSEWTDGVTQAADQWAVNTAERP